MSIPIIPKDETTKGGWSDDKKIYGNKSENAIREIAENIKEAFCAKTIIEDKGKDIWIYQGKFYESCGKQKISRICAENDIPSSKIINKIISLAYIEKKEFYKSFKHPTEFTLVNLNNCVHDWYNDHTYPHDDKYMFKYCLPIDYDRYANCPIFKGMISGMLKNWDDEIELKKWLGYHLMPGVWYQKFAVFVGPEASSKGKLLNVLIKIVGEGNSSGHTLQDLVNPTKYFIQDIETKLANVCGDQTSDTLRRKNLGVIYQLTGEDIVSGRAIRQMPKTFRPVCKITLSYNKLPTIDMGIYLANEFWRRLILFETKKYYINPDPYFEMELMNELPGIYNYIVDGAKLLIKEGFKDNRGKSGDYLKLKNKWIGNMMTESKNIHIPSIPLYDDEEMK